MDLSPPPPNPQLPYDPSTLPIGQLESLKFKISQIIESIQSLQRTIEYGIQTGDMINPNAMPPWPDILAKYNLLVSQTHTLSSALSANMGGQTTGTGTGSSGLRPKIASSNPYDRLALHPHVPLPDSQLDNELIPLLRNQQTTQVLNDESSLVARLANSPAFSNTTASMNGIGPTSARSKPPSEQTHEHVLRTCDSIRSAHDSRADRALRAVTMLRDKYDWKARVEITFPVSPPPEPMVTTGASPHAGMETPGHDEDGSSDDAEELEDVAGMVDDFPEGDIGEMDDDTSQSGIFTPS